TNVSTAHTVINIRRSFWFLMGCNSFRFARLFSNDDRERTKRRYFGCRGPKAGLPVWPGRGEKSGQRKPGAPTAGLEFLRQLRWGSSPTVREGALSQNALPDGRATAPARLFFRSSLSDQTGTVSGQRTQSPGCNNGRCSHVA